MTSLQKVLSVCFAYLLFSLSVNANDKGGKYAAVISLESGTQIGFSYHLPSSYQKGQVYPALIGPGNAKVEEEHGFFWRYKPSSHGWIIIETPVMYELNEMQGAEAVSKILDYMNAHYKIEGHKFHGIGWSANSGKAFNRVVALSERFHSITGLPGHPRNISEQVIKKLNNVKVNFIVGENDSYWLKKSKDAEYQLRRNGIDTLIEIVPNAEHVLQELIDDGLFKRLDKIR